MKNILKLIKIAILIAFAWCIVSAVKPYWNKYWLGQAIENAAIYGTKRSVQDTRKFLTEKMNEDGHNFAGKDFTIEKDENNNVTISIRYSDEINIFGVKLKSLYFTLEKTVSEVESIL
jgi:hypothetical protein